MKEEMKKKRADSSNADVNIKIRKKKKKKKHRDDLICTAGPDTDIIRRKKKIKHCNQELDVNKNSDLAKSQDPEVVIHLEDGGVTDTKDNITKKKKKKKKKRKSDDEQYEGNKDNEDALSKLKDPELSPETEDCVSEKMGKRKKNKKRIEIGIDTSDTDLHTVKRMKKKKKKRSEVDIDSSDLNLHNNVQDKESRNSDNDLNVTEGPEITIDAVNTSLEYNIKKKRKKKKKKKLHNEECEVNKNCNCVLNTFKKSNDVIKIEPEDDGFVDTEVIRKHKKKKKFHKKCEENLNNIQDLNKCKVTDNINKTEDIEQHEISDLERNNIHVHSRKKKRKRSVNFEEEKENTHKQKNNSLKSNIDDIDCTMYAVSDSGFFKCTLSESCSAKYLHRESLMRHIRFHHFKEENYKCDMCDKTFLNYSTMLQHKTCHYNENISDNGAHVCDLCEKRYKLKKSLMRHIKNVHSSVKLPYECDICQKKFLYKSYLEQHKSSHLEKCFQCDECMKTFKSKQTLRHHQRSVHAKDVNYVCGTCNKGFSEQSTLLKHETSHLKSSDKSHVADANSA